MDQRLSVRWCYWAMVESLRWETCVRPLGHLRHAPVSALLLFLCYFLAIRRIISLCPGFPPRCIVLTQAQSNSQSEAKQVILFISWLLLVFCYSDEAVTKPAYCVIYLSTPVVFGFLLSLSLPISFAHTGWPHSASAQLLADVSTDCWKGRVAC